MSVRLPKPVPGEIWSVTLQNGVRASGPVAVDDNENNPNDWQAAFVGAHGDRFEFTPYPGDVDLTKQNYQPHPADWVWSQSIGWHPLGEGFPEETAGVVRGNGAVINVGEPISMVNVGDVGDVSEPISIQAIPVPTVPSQIIPAGLPVAHRSNRT